MLVHRGWHQWTKVMFGGRRSTWTSVNLSRAAFQLTVCTASSPFSLAPGQMAIHKPTDGFSFTWEFYGCALRTGPSGCSPCTGKKREAPEVQIRALSTALIIEGQAGFINYEFLVKIQPKKGSITLLYVNIGSPDKKCALCHGICVLWCNVRTIPFRLLHIQRRCGGYRDPPSTSNTYQSSCTVKVRVCCICVSNSQLPRC